MTVKKNYILAVWRVLALPVWIIVLPLLFVLTRVLKFKINQQLPHYFHWGMRKILGIDVTFSGEVSEIKPSLYISNHISYLDIIVLGDVRAFFIAKSEVASWPVLGSLAKYQNTLFIERNRGKARQQLEVMQHHLSGGNSLILFPEGTSTDGTHVEPFKSSLFEAANMSGTGNNNDVRVAIQPVTIAYTHQAGQKMDRVMLDHYAWYGTMPFGGHMAALLPLKKVDVKVHFHPVCYLDEFETRKQCADHCQQTIAKQLQEFIA